MAFYLGLKKAIVGIFLLSIFSLSSSGIIDKNEKIKNKLRKDDYRTLAHYSFSSKISLEKRIHLPPDFVLKYLKDLDGKDNYIAYMPNENEKQNIIEQINRLPLLHRKIFSKRLIGIYFIENFTGNGFTEWVLDSKDNIYFFMVFNTSVLRNNMNQGIAYRINSCFFPDENYEFKVDISEKEMALLYLLLHEGTHGVDYVLRLQNYVDSQSYYFQKRFSRSIYYDRDIWKTYSLPKPEYDFSLRDKITFYGLNKGPKLRYESAVYLYRGFENSVFPTLYASLSWAEDIAESLTIYHLHKKLNLNYKVYLYHKGKKIYTYSLENRKNVYHRLQLMEAFYSPQNYSIFLPKE